jgi:hypothetical protein
VAAAGELWSDPSLPPAATAELNSVDALAWLAGVLHRIAEHSASQPDELVPWSWKPPEIYAAT